MHQNVLRKAASSDHFNGRIKKYERRKQKILFQTRIKWRLFQI